MAPVMQPAIQDEKARGYFQTFDRQAYHAHEVGIRDNLVLLAAAGFFAMRGSVGYGVDNWLGDWVIRLF
jgi:hypothetical protein